MQTFRNSQESGQSQEKDRSTTTEKVKKTCSHCGKDYHTTDRYYFLHGFPPGHKLYGKDIKPRGKRPNVNNSTTEENSKVQSFTNTTFILEEYNQHKALLQKNISNVLPFVNTTSTHSSPFCAEWIIDSGATNHVSNILPTRDKTTARHNSVQLPNGGQAKIEYSHFDPEITSQDSRVTAPTTSDHGAHLETHNEPEIRELDTVASNLPSCDANQPGLTSKPINLIPEAPR
ncbi:hypothetical protein LWI28_010761 [Acer negundo]|uniref:Uncharacterized protein n=1 Tax=Acer negundo TaxID=4023 RepID=A0AAD5I9Y1_ACENE|nr:hypothetical protein LWI28_010761 [Acer negundo]